MDINSLNNTLDADLYSKNYSYLRKERLPEISEIDDLKQRAAQAIQAGTEFLLSVQREEKYWCAELESNSTITSEYVFLSQILGLDISAKKDKIIRYLLNQQQFDGSWAIAESWMGDVSTTAETYLALRILGLDEGHPVLLKAEKYIRSHGGLEKIRVFTRIFFAMFGLVPWEAVPLIPAEFILFPDQFPVNIYSLASWARSTMVPLFVITHHRPIYLLPNGYGKNNPLLDHLWLNPDNKKDVFSEDLISVISKNRFSWKSVFGISEPLLKMYEKKRHTRLRNHALNECTEWILERQEASGDWGGIFPPMINGVIALSLRGYTLESPEIKKGLQAIEKFSWEDQNGYRIQACVSPVWDTVLSTVSLVDSGFSTKDERVEKAIKWVLDRQVNVDYGDWKVSRPQLQSGGWSFEYFNSWYPDVDDTAAVILALIKQDPSSVYSEPLKRAIQWILGMQCRDGGWAAFDVNNDKIFLNDIPFSDMNSLCDPSSPDVTGRVLEALGLYLRTSGGDGPEGEKNNIIEDSKNAKIRGIEYLRLNQEVQGSWFGRWGVNYIYGTSNVLCGLAQAGLPASDPMVIRAIHWLKRVQNRDGGWGEGLESYQDKKWMGQGESTPSQTAWAILALLNYCPPQDGSISRGIHWLIFHQKLAKSTVAYEGGKPVPEAKGSTWEESQYTGTGFPNHFYLRYNYYRHYFPMMALGRYLNGFIN